MGSEIKIFHLNELAVTINIADDISPQNTDKVVFLKNKVFNQNWPWLKECVSAYNSITIFVEIDFYRFHPSLLDFFTKFLGEFDNQIDNSNINNKDILEIEVNYCGEDIDYVAHYANISRKELIKLHTRPVYIVGMIGFLPGFPYLIGLDPKLYAPRKLDPKLKIEKGSVAIGGNQTGIYPIESPGGWQIVGKTTQEMFNLENLSFLKIGDRIKFISI